MTALSLITEAYPVKNGEAVLVHAAAGNVGQLLCQMYVPKATKLRRRLMVSLHRLRNIGAFVIGTAGSPQKCAMAKEYGAHECIDYSDNKQWPQAALAVTNGEGFDVGEDLEMCHTLLLCLHDTVFDSVGVMTWDGSLAVTKRKGKVVSFGHSSGLIPPFDITRLLEKNLSIARVTLTQYITTRDELLHFANMLFEIMLQGKLKVNYHVKEYALHDIRRAHGDLGTRQTSGRVLVKM
jgi:NADPH2:quinone reductase